MTLRLVVSLAGAVCALTACSGERAVDAISSPATAAAPASSIVSSTVADDEPDSELVGFTIPTGAISCMLDRAYARCDVLEHSWDLPPRPVDCEFDYGQGISLAAGEEAEIVCAGDTTLGAGEPLEYGKSVTVGSMSCESTEVGVTCREVGGGHGFTVARERYTLF